MTLRPFARHASAAATAPEPAEMLSRLASLTIDDYGAIGNCKSVALVSKLGSIDWWCLPHFSGPSYFAGLLDRERGGCFMLCPRDIVDTRQAYVDGSVVLRTRFRCESGVLELSDFLAVGWGREIEHRLHPQHRLVRIARCVEGSVTLDALYQPRPDYARRLPRLASRGRLGWQCSLGSVVAHLQSDLEFSVCGEAALGASVTLNAGEQCQCVLGSSENEIGVFVQLGAEVEELETTTIAWWQAWSARCTYDGPYRAQVLRSALTLKLLTYCLSGAVVAAATTSLPEGELGSRNWDYRFCWLRDTSLVLRAFMDLGFYEESGAFIAWLLHATRLTRPHLQVMYDIYGETALDESELPHLRGYRGIGPVRVGNDAVHQRQHDVYGEVVLTAYEYVARGGRLDPYERGLIADFAATACRLWREPDQGLWEIRLPARHNTHSKLMCWVALDRSLRLHERIGVPIDAEATRRELAAIREDIDANAWVPSLDSYVGYYGGDQPDASLLLMPHLGYVDANDPRMIGTRRFIEERLAIDGLIYRYPPGPRYDGVAGTENLFGICSFWRIDCIARQGDVRRAEAMFRELLGLANPLGLLPEEFDVGTRRARGNFPQAFSHVGLIFAAKALERARRGGVEHAQPMPAEREPEAAR